MRKGIFFALLFGAFFLLLFTLLAYYSENLNSRDQLSLEDRKLAKNAFIADDVATDLLSLLEISKLRLDGNAGKRTILISEEFSTGIPSPGLAAYAEFIEGEYAKRTGMNGRLKMHLEKFEESPRIIFPNSGFDYSYGSLSKDEATFRGGSSIEGFFLGIAAATPDTFTDCGWESRIDGDLQVKILLDAQGCAPQELFLDKDAENNFWANTSSGKYINITFGSVDGKSHSFKMRPGLVGFHFDFNVTFAGAQPEAAILPVGVEFIGEYSLDNLQLQAD